jgi:flagellar hook-associated protein 3 FlgL
MSLGATPTSRLSNAFIAQQILSQIQTNQSNLFTVQQQLASGRRVLAPSDDAQAAARAITLQSLLERKGTVAESLSTNASYLAASDDALGSVADLMSELRATALSVTGNNVSVQERQAALAEVDAAVNRLLVTANQTFRDRYLFSGSNSLQPPFVRTTNGIAYVGNDNSLSALSDINQLFSTNVTGHQAFGAYSQAQLGVVDLNPVMTRETRLADLNGGAGINVGSIKVSDGTKTSVVNIAGAATIGDVARLLESNPPPGRTLTARVTSTGLEITLSGGQLSIDEVGGGQTALSLGIKRVGVAGPGPLVGEDLNPKLSLITAVKDILGTRARAYVPALGSNNDLLIEANSSGAALNGVKVKYVDDDWFQADPGITAGNEYAQYLTTATAASAVLKFPGRPGLDNGIQLTSATPGSALNGVSVSLTVRAVDGLGTQTVYNPTSKTYAISVETGTTVGTALSDINTGGGPFTAATTSYGSGAYVLTAADNNGGAGNTYETGSDAGTLVVHIEPNKTSANQAIAAINAEGTFTAISDPTESGNGQGKLLDSYQEAGAIGTTAGGSGENLDLAHGLQISNGGQTFTIDLSEAKSMEDVLNSVNGSGAQVTATINAAGTGIDIRSRLSGTKFSIGENGGTLATQLGIRTLTTTTALNSLNNGKGVDTAPVGDDFTITSRDGTSFNVNLTSGNAASARVAGAGLNSGLLISRKTAGLSGNQYSVQIVDSGVGGGNAVSLVGNTLRLDVDLTTGFTAQQAANLVAQNSSLSAQFSIQLDKSADQNNDGSGNLAATGSVAFTGGTDVARTIGDVLNLINNNPANLASSAAVNATLNAFGNGITLANDGPLGSAPFSITRLGTSSAAQDLGLIPNSDTTNSSATVGNRSTVAIPFAGANNDLVISAAQSGASLNGVTIRFANDGVAGNNSAAYDATARVLTIDVDPATTTAQDIVDLLANDPRFRATLAPTDGGPTNNGSGTLGTLPADSTLAGGSADVLTGVDTNLQQVDGIFTSLMQLREAIESGDLDKLQAAIGVLDVSADNLSYSRADLGARMKAVDALQSRISLENISLKGAISTEIEVDIVSAISEMATRQAAYEASLRVSAAMTKSTLLDFL